MMSDTKVVLTKADCESILGNYAKKVELTSYTIEPLSDTVEGLVGEHFIARIGFQGERGGDETRRFFVKVINGKSPVLFEMAQSIAAYQKEDFFYTHLINECENMGIDVSYAPKSYLCKPYKIVLEDLSLRGFSNRGKREFFDVAHCEAALRALAKFHASGIIYETDKSISLLEKFPEQFAEKLFARDGNAAAKWLNCSVQGFVELIAHLDIPQQTKTEFVSNLRSFHRNLHQIVKPSNKHKCTILHGDLWSNNFLFKYADDSNKPISTVLIDYQMMKYGYPAIDVVQMILTNTRKAFRDEYYNSMLSFYHKNLMDCLRERGIDGFMTEEDFLQVCQEVKAAVKIQATADRSTTFLSEESFADAVGDDELFARFLFEDRSKCMVSSFLTNDLFREIIEEDLLELCQMLAK